MYIMRHPVSPVSTHNKSAQTSFENNNLRKKVKHNVKFLETFETINYRFDKNTRKKPVISI